MNTTALPPTAAASLTLTALWILAQIAIQLLPAIIESGIIGLMGL